jgi:Transposase DDE domain
MGSQDRTKPRRSGRTGSKHHLITDATGIPLAVTLTGGNRNDITQLIPRLQVVPPYAALPLCEEVVRPQWTKKARSYALLATPNL